MKLSSIVKALRGELTMVEFAKALAVSPSAVCTWENGGRVGEWNRQKLLAYARAKAATPDLVTALEAAQPEFRPPAQ